ncbi:hypothetical protein LX16_0691 [Stackebrandtia albiflava]|uniref:Uncharacterized protein n=2 Tax=Stackebrandtia albiflava TaxID=406432 RepID=A0A562VAV4_9ACTN|nr:hypothetical protein LX16_0691 [Stackebrandtia albiflava]
MAVAAGHTALVTAMTWPHWPGWLSGELWWAVGSGEHLDSALAFWSVPGGFVVPLVLVGLTALRSARDGRTLPGHVGVIMLVWAAFGSYVAFPTGFPLLFAPAVLILFAARQDRAVAATPEPVVHHDG